MTAGLRLVLVPLGLAAACMGLRYLLLGMGAHRARAKSQPWDSLSNRDWAKPLLPSQQDFVRQFMDELMQRDVHVLSPKLHAIRGVWGSGKSTLVNAMLAGLRAEWRDSSGKSRPRFLPVYLNAWREETPDDLHFRLIEHIALEPMVWHYTASRLTWRFLRGIAWGRSLGRQWWPKMLDFKSLVKAKAGAGEASVEASTQWHMPTPLTFQEDLERMMRALRAENVQLVLFIDEIERGTRSSAQAMVVLLKRSFDLPGLHVVVPYVREVMEAMVFNPLQQMSKELRMSTSAVLYTDSTLRRAGFAQVHQKLSSPAKWGEKHSPASRLEMPAIDLDLAEVFSMSLMKDFLSCDAQTRRPLQNLMQEKYFGSGRDVPRITAADLAHLVMHQPCLRQVEYRAAIKRLLSAWSSHDDETATDAVSRFFDDPADPDSLAALEDAIGRLMQRPIPAMRLGAGEFSIRSFEGELRRSFDRWQSADRLVASRATGPWSASALPAEPSSQIAEMLALLVMVVMGLVYAGMGSSSRTQAQRPAGAAV